MHAKGGIVGYFIPTVLTEHRALPSNSILVINPLSEGDRLLVKSHLGILAEKGRASSVQIFGFCCGAKILG